MPSIIQDKLIHFLIPPDRGSLTESFIFKTAIFASLNLKEARTILLNDYKYKCSFSITATTSEEVGLIRSLTQSKATHVIMPIWGQSIIFTSSQNTSDTIYFNTRKLLIEVGYWVVVFNLGESVPQTVCKVVEVSPGNYIKIENSVTITKDTVLAIAKRGKLSKSLTSTALRGNQEKFDLTFEEY